MTDKIEIRKVGRWTYQLTKRSQMPDLDWIGWDCGRVWGLRRARRRAERLLELDHRVANNPPSPVEVITRG